MFMIINNNPGFIIDNQIIIEKIGIMKNKYFIFIFC